MSNDDVDAGELSNLTPSTLAPMVTTERATSATRTATVGSREHQAA
jgi:hypothetical protein